MEPCKGRKWKLSWEMYQQGKDWIHYSSYTVLNISQLLRKWVIHVHLFCHRLNKFSLTLLHFCWCSAASKRKFYCSFAYVFLHLNRKRTVAWVEIHLLDSYSVWHEITIPDTLEETGEMEYGKHIGTTVEKNMVSI